MPIVIPSEQSVELQPLGLPSNAPELGDSGLGAITAGLDVASDQMRAAQIEIQRKRNATKLFEAEVALDDLYRPIETQMRQRRGSASFGVTDGMSAWWEAEPHKIMDSLENEAQRELFAESIARRRAVSLDSFSEFEANETHNGLNQAADAAITSAINMGAAGYNNPETRDLARETILERVQAQSTINGWSAPERDQARESATTKLHQQVIENMIDDDPAAAGEYFEANKGEIAGSVWDTLRGNIETGNTVAAAQTLADDIWSRGLIRTEALAAARSEAEGQKREQALTLLRQQYQEEDQAIDDHRAGVVHGAWETFNEGGLAALSASQIAELQRVDPQTLTAMNARNWTPQDAIVTNWDVYYGTLDFAKADRAGFADLDLRHLQGDLNAREYTVLQDMQADILEDRASPTATLTQILNEVPWESSDREREGLFDRKVREAVAAEQRRQARELSESEIRDIVDRQLIEVRIPRAWWRDKSTQLFEVTPEERENMILEYDAIPPGDRDELEADLIAAGQEASPELVVRVYREWLRQGNQ
jgi:hypothetical protein